MEKIWLFEQFFRFREEKMRAVPSELYTEEYYLSSCRGFEEFLKGKISQRLLDAFSLADLKKGMHVLDVGTGRGELVIRCAEEGAWCQGIDYSQAAVKIAKESLGRVDRKVAKRIDFKRMNIKRTAYPDRSFDVVFMIDVVEHLYPEELRQALLEIKRVVKSSGRVIVHTPNAWLIEIIYFFSKIFFKWGEHERHVNKQGFFSLRRELRLLGGRRRIYFRPRKKCFSEIARSTKGLPSWAIRLAAWLDKLWENKIVSFLIYHTPLVFFLGTDLWAVVDFKK